ncbi:MAG: hypothetical protein AB7P34_14745 [Vicinamibacterales bacterium]
MTAALAFVLLLAQAAAPQTPTAPPVAPPPADPATSAFTGEAGLMLVAIKPLLVADYELVIRTLQAALAKETDPARRAAASGWRVYKATPADAKGNALYIHTMLPAVPGFDYRPSLLVDTLVNDLPPDLLNRYRDSLAGPPSKLDLTELANMVVAPVEPAPVKKPGGAS